MQNPDGGFSSYVCGLPGKPPGPLFLRPPELDLSKFADMGKFLVAPPLEFGDPSTEDVTGRVLHGLGQIGFTEADARVQRALRFVQSQQLEDGSFWGRWLTNYLASTAYVVRGALAVGVSAQAPWLVRALDFLEAQQQSCGAWGESVESYRSPETHKARGPACAAQTGRVLCALIEGGRAEQPGVASGLAWLRATQRADGTWDGAHHLAALYPPDTFYRHAAAATYYPLWAMALR